MMEHRKKLIFIIAIIVYLCVIIFVTIIGRTPCGYYRYKLIPFWSYREWFLGNDYVGRQIIGNICAFVPLGILVGLASSGTELKKKVIFCIVLSAAISFLIEIIQLLFQVGYFEFDDIFNNTMGSIIGFGLMLICCDFKKNSF